MSTFVIKSDNQNTKILKELAKILGADVINSNEEQYEDLVLGLLIDRSKTIDNSLLFNDIANIEIGIIGATNLVFNIE